MFPHADTPFAAHPMISASARLLLPGDGLTFEDMLSLARRAVTALFATWFALAGTESGAIGACPEHSASAMTMASAAASAEHHGLAHAAHAPANDSQQAPVHHCNCPGTCCAATAALRPDAPRLQVVPEKVLRVARFAIPAAPEAREPDHVIPFATAPPAPLA